MQSSETRPRAWPLTAALALASVVLAGCAVQQHEKDQAVDAAAEARFLADKPAPLHRHYRQVLVQGPRNAVLNNLRSGLAAMELGEWELAARSFDEALGPIEAIYANNPKAAEARSLFVKENIKDFRGEPYERAMAYYYRGLLYLRAGDWGNARASFKSAMLQDSLAAAEEYQADFAMIAWLEGWASHCEGNGPLAREAFAEAARLQPGLMPPAPADNLLLVAELGLPPVKQAQGRSRELLTLSPNGNAAETGARFSLGAYSWREGQGRAARSLSWGPVQVAADRADSISRQATTRGGREVDGILEGKAQFKDGTNAAGTALVAGGSAAMMVGSLNNNSNMAGVGAAFMLAGLIAQAAAEAMRPEADTRMWDNLPDSVAFTTLALPAGVPAQSLDLTARFEGPAGASLPGEARGLMGGAGRCSLGWVRSRPAAGIPDQAPNSGAGAGRT